MLPPELVDPHPERLSPERPDHEVIVAAHRGAVAAGESMYDDPMTGLSVLTARYLWDRGTCCDTGCRHCPYLPRPRRP